MELQLSQKNNIDSYVKTVSSEWLNWSKGGVASNRILETLHESIRNIFYRCRIPRTRLRISSDNYKGDFGVTLWSILMDTQTLVNTREQVIEAAKMMYIGAAMAERQWYGICDDLYLKRKVDHLGQFTINKEDQETVRKSLGISQDILIKAVDAICKYRGTTRSKLDPYSINKVTQSLQTAFASIGGTVHPQPLKPSPVQPLIGTPKVPHP